MPDQSPFRQVLEKQDQGVHPCSGRACELSDEVTKLGKSLHYTSLMTRKDPRLQPHCNAEVQQTQPLIRDQMLIISERGALTCLIVHVLRQKISHFQ